ncbi:hypothetical protein Rhein_1343 [Rheinheimera sp. A13L]|uniref:hypothetical protein n=1 Tax=Rheinheimera sp. A13L TaxID=506534 RepID=UPI0002124D49|nr:hypothetical protein [Rheinheimera sp. A13L]EGM78567.1 hypothetical protein Rhein_1343 [Rheinheimera sp. A13L]
MVTKKLVNYGALTHFILYGLVFFVFLLNQYTVPDNYVHFLLNFLGLSFIGLTTAKSHLVNCFAFSAIVSSTLLTIASLLGAVISGEFLMVFAGYFFVCWGIALANTIWGKVFNFRANNQVLSPAKSADCDN